MVWHVPLDEQDLGQSMFRNVHIFATDVIYKDNVT